MHYPNPIGEYEEGLRRVANAIEMARRGAYRDGYLQMILEALEFLEKASYQMGMSHRDGQMLKRLQHEFKSQLEPQQEHSGVSPLAALAGETKHDEYSEHHEEHKEHQEGDNPRKNPLQPRR